MFKGRNLLVFFTTAWSNACNIWSRMQRRAVGGAKGDVTLGIQIERGMASSQRGKCGFEIHI